MADAHEASSSHSSASPSPAPVAAPVPASVKEKAPQQAQDEFSSIYLKKITAELADDLVKVRDAQDFKASSLPMLVHALRQGSSIYSAEEKRRVVNAAD
jgi:ribosome assembly protein 3